jgi:uncharacterized protein
MKTRVALAVLAIALAAALAAIDLRAAVIGGIHAYHRIASPLAAHAGARCRLTPTCSRYAEIVIARDGVIRGGSKTLRRLARCGPWTTPGTQDQP